MQLYALNTKLRAMRGALFNKADYEALCRLGSVQQIADRLREKESYRPLLSHGEGEWRRGEIERSILSAIYPDFSRMRYFIFDDTMLEFMNALFLNTLVSLIKKLLCTVYDDKDTSHEFNEWDAAFAAEQHINLPRLAASKTVPEFIHNLSGSVFYQELNTVAGETSTLFELEQELDMLYYRHVWKKTDMLDKKNREIMQRIIGQEIDLRNILWVYRFKKYYSVPVGTVLAGLIPIPYKLSAESLRLMVDSDTIRGVLDEVSAGPYHSVFKDFDNPERDFTHALRRSYQQEIRNNPFSIAVAASYLFEKEEEINSITTALEGVRYELPAAEIMKYIYL